ncbi:MAG: hypothetical protein ACE5FH_07395 [Candidatus Zixiibacteriota bacterium]
MLRKVSVAVLVVAMMAGPSLAGSHRPVKFLVQGGISWPGQSYLYTFYDPGTHFAAGIGTGVYDGLDIYAVIERHDLSFNWGPLPVNGRGHDFSAWTFGLQGRYSPPILLNIPFVPIKPFATAEVGIASVNYTAGDVPGRWEFILRGEDQTRTYIGFGAGFDYAVSPRFNLFVYARGIRVGTDAAVNVKRGTWLVPVSVGVRF